MSNMRGEFLQWSGEHGGFGCEEAAFEAGWSAALNTVVTPNTSTNTASPKLLDELKGILDSLSMFGCGPERRRIYEIVQQLRAGCQ